MKVSHDLFKTKFKFSDYRDFTLGRNTISRIIHDAFIKDSFHLLSGKVLELGASYQRDYSQHAFNAKTYTKSNFEARGNIELEIDARQMALADNSYNGIVCLNVLEHVEDFKSVFKEIFRVLKPGGTLILTVPFVYYYHAAPDDYYRFTVSALKKNLSNYTDLKLLSIGNKWSNLAHCLQGPDWIKGKRVYASMPLRILGLAFLLNSLRYELPDNYSLEHGVIAVK